MQINQKHNDTPQFRVFNEQQAEMIFRGALDIMERTGGNFYSEEALEIFRNSDALVEGNNVKIPAWMVRKALNDTPEKITLYSRDGSSRLDLGRDLAYFGTGTDCPFIYDRKTGERRRYTAQDVNDAARLSDYLPNIDFFGSHGLASDAPHKETYDRHQYYSMVKGTAKPLILTAVDGEGLADIHKMSCMLAGGEDKFRLYPHYAVYVEPSSPLAHSKTCVEKLLYCARHSIPCIYTPCPSAGATAPATLAGMLAQTLAETLQGMVLAHLVKPGMPLVMGAVVTIMDMKTSNYCYGAPELSLAQAALTDVARYLNLPMFSTGGCSDARVLDEQAALEYVISLETAFLSGASLIHDVGYLDSGLNGSLEALVMCDEIIGMVKHLGKGIEVNEDHLAPGLIDEVGPGGQFLTCQHTFRHYKEEFYFPELLDRNKIEDWMASGKKTILDHINTKLDKILAEHEPAPLSADVDEEMKRIIRIADAKAEARKK